MLSPALISGSRQPDARHNATEIADEGGPARDTDSRNRSHVEDMESRTRKRWWCWSLLGAMCWVGVGAAWAAEITARLPSGLTAYADYRVGEADKTAVLILHGFMTTQNFNVIRTLAAELHNEGHTVLAPTLTLGIDQRRGGLACEAIHTHTMEHDLQELAWWTDWLSQRHPGPLALIGHSSGSLQAIAYAGTKPDRPLSVVIATSPIYFGQDYAEDFVQRQIERARAHVQQGDAPLQRYALTFCDHNFVATSESYLSYATWNRQRVLESARAAEVPIYAVLGGNDPRATSEWQLALRQAGVHLTVLDGASHFFDGVHEFDLLDYVHSVLRQTAAGKAEPGAS